MIYRILADGVVTIHFGFILFVVFGGLLAIRRRWILFLHLPAAIWGALIEFQGWLCPLTTLEWKLRQVGGETAYHQSFIEHYLVPIVYPDRLTPELQAALGIAVLLINGAIYGWLIRRCTKAERGKD
ncbi:Protein of Unknown function [Syntrophus gentianae]|uniref:DUF2784 domain-containing protein n=1 Tax=Syntrophus gentianae TaxID=43775 RepID=A0A1H7YC46_9BACT|nr:DUF2784 domain-containing protein [Syntrophus gentianae]SEM43434.1 Protein of Unknown function [Syntrophus gentianae]